jgi:2-polyprenyl-3-methyl-5-hydroxy-6-metoxy-1,4-benzoquinol methylase
MAHIDFYRDEFEYTRSDDLLQREIKSIQYMSEIVKELTKLRKNAKIKLLDVGCGRGVFLQHFAKNFKKFNIELYGTDISKPQIEKAKKLGFKFKRSDLEKGINYQDETFNIVYAAELIEHLYNPDLLIQEINRILKPNGYIIISTPNLVAWFNRILFFLGNQPLFYETSTKSTLIGSGIVRKIKARKLPVGHIRIFTKGALKDILQEYGFEVLEIKGAAFDSGLKGILLKIDSLFNHIPCLASDLVVLARKK